jgi:signal peptidase II
LRSSVSTPCRTPDTALSASNAKKMESAKPNPPLFWGVMITVVALDVATKLLAVARLSPQHIPHEVIGNHLRLTLVYNPGAAFGLHLGGYSRWIFMALTIGALIVLGRLYQATRQGDLVRTLALGLVCGGAVGNLIDRVRSPIGVVDFIDVGLRDMRWPTFNVADMAVSVGAFLLAWVLWGEERETALVRAAPVSETSTEG